MNAFNTLQALAALAAIISLLTQFVPQEVQPQEAAVEVPHEKVRNKFQDHGNYYIILIDRTVQQVPAEEWQNARL